MAFMGDRNRFIAMNLAGTNIAAYKSTVACYVVPHAFITVLYHIIIG